MKKPDAKLARKILESAIPGYKPSRKKEARNYSEIENAIISIWESNTLDGIIISSLKVAFENSAYNLIQAQEGFLSLFNEYIECLRTKESRQNILSLRNAIDELFSCIPDSVLSEIVKYESGKRRKLKWSTKKKSIFLSEIKRQILSNLPEKSRLVWREYGQLIKFGKDKYPEIFDAFTFPTNEKPEDLAERVQKMIRRGQELPSQK